MLRRLWCLPWEPKDKQYKAKGWRSLTQTVQRLLKFYARVQEIHRSNQQTQHSNLGQLNSLPIMCILPLQHGYLCILDWLDPTINCVPRINLLVTNLFYIQLITAAGWDENGMLQTVSWSLGRPLSDLMSVSRGSPNRPIRCNQKHRRVFLIISSQAENCKASECWRTVFGLVINFRWRMLKLHEDFAKS